MSQIPSWLLALIKLAIQIGSPYLLDLVKKWIGNLPAEIVDIINELIKNIKDPAVSTRDAKRNALEKVKECSGVACPPQTKK